MVLIIVVMEGLSWKERADFHQIQLSPHTQEVYYHDLDMFNHYFMLNPGITAKFPEKISSQEAELLQSNHLISADKIDIPLPFKNDPMYELLHEEGTFHAINETLMVQRQLLIDEFERIVSLEIPDGNEQYLEEELELELKGIWEHNNRLFLQANLEDPNAPNGPISQKLHPNHLSINFVHFDLENDDYNYPFRLYNHQIEVMEDQSWEIMFELENHFYNEIFLAYINTDEIDYFDHRIQIEGDTLALSFVIIPEDRMHRLDPETFKSDDFERSSMIEIPIQSPVGEEYMVDQIIPLTAAHNLHIHRIINFDNHSAWEVELLSENENEFLQYIEMVIKNDEPEDHFYSHFYGDIVLPIKNQPNKYLLLHEPIPNEEQSTLNINIIEVSIFQDKQYLVDLNNIQTPSQVLSYQGWTLSVEEIDYIDNDFPHRIDLHLEYRSPFEDQLRTTNEEGADHQFGLLNSFYLLGTHKESGEVIYAHQRAFSRMSTSMYDAVEEGDISFRFSRNEFWSQAPDMHRSLHSNDWGAGEYDFQLLVSSFFTDVSDIDFTINVASTGEFYKLER